LDPSLSNVLQARPIGIDTFQEPVIYMRSDCAVCRSEGFQARSRVLVSSGERALIATVNVVNADWLAHGEAGLSQAAWTRLGAKAPCSVALSHPDPVESFQHVRSKLFGNVLTDSQIEAIVEDVAAWLYSDVQLSAFLSACVGDRVELSEIVALTRAMVAAGATLTWPVSAVFDKHCVGIVVAIVTACGIVMPKTSSRAITSPAGTADTMETLTRVDLSLDHLRQVVEREGGCLAWGGSVNLSPVDDLLIRVERSLDLDSEAQLVASVLSKKVAAGATHALIDIPVGPSAKVRDEETAQRLANRLRQTGAALGLNVQVMATDGSQPVGRGIGPALEARDVLAVLRGQPQAPEDLAQRAVLLAGAVLEQSGYAELGAGEALAAQVLEDGRAWHKFQRICEAQGGLREPPVAHRRHDIVADRAGRVGTINNRQLAKLAKLAGAPTAAAAGVDLLVRNGTVHAETPGELAYALSYLTHHPELIQLDGTGAETPR
jgi:thymidine phosphorylase